MTKRLYYADPYKTRFTARVLERLTWDRHPAVVLDRTAFYPASGGQPADGGTLDGATILHVVERPAEGAGHASPDVIHVLSQPMTKDKVTGEVAWPRRFDHMQQHTGQHVLSAAVQQTLGAETVGFHLGHTSSTIDVDVADLEMEDILPTERLANAVVWDDRPVTARFVQPRELAELHAQAPPDVKGSVRLVEISAPPGAEGPRFDLNPCGGTHVRRTGEIGIIKIVNLEHRGEDTRVEFVCGGRALRDYEALRHVTAALSHRLTTGTGDLVDAVTRLQEENKALRRAERELRDRLLDIESEQLVGAAADRGPYRVVSGVWPQRSPDELRILARKLAEGDDVVALLFGVGERTHLCFARADGLNVDVNQLLQEACSRLGGRGGGRAEVAQGSAPQADLETIKALLDNLESALEETH